ncbi:GNAT family N-acetyltransferase [Alteromonas pelagimontana]|uniref:GNAT family N-acetyltransferase n=1 Tax=Alteromonas pelagimontana TaxID=1858656 RepID=A0A6M4MAU9_9ALTE|nr:GNAT family N-acetyltransferase [Alteromonas pelagimontana]QJR80109.1 GNAT family N-acetyltransferase [Alteromonas pelagimontana]
MGNKPACAHIEYQLLAPEHFAAVIKLGNEVQGENYLNAESLVQMYEKSWHNGINASLVALHQTAVVGFRLTFAPHHWQPDQWCSPGQWPVAADKVCYFKCNTVDENLQGCGIGSKMLSMAIEQAKKQGAEAGLAHIWLASPGNSAFRYFSSNGGKLIKKHPGKWRHASLFEGYICPVCPGHCECEAAEMILPFS